MWIQANGFRVLGAISKFVGHLIIPGHFRNLNLLELIIENHIEDGEGIMKSTTL
jgi:hypothetical protein